MLRSFGHAVRVMTISLSALVGIAGLQMTAVARARPVSAATQHDRSISGNTIQVQALATQHSETGVPIRPIRVVATDTAPNETLWFNAYDLPPGLSIARNTGIISGTPNLAVTVNVTMMAHDSTGATGVMYFWWVVDSSVSNAGMMAAAPNGLGYWLTGPTGKVDAFGLTADSGSMAGQHLAKPIVGIASTRSGFGYWLVASDGGVFTFGDARYYGSTGAMKLAKPIVGMTPTPSGKGYWLVGSDGGVFTFGDARFYGSAAAIKLVKPVVALVVAPGGHGYWMVASDGGVFNFGNAQFYGSAAKRTLPQPIVGVATTPLGLGYWMATAAHDVLAFGDTPVIAPQS